MINTGSNDYLGGTIPTGTEAGDSTLIERARQVSLGYCYWLQNECPRDDAPSEYGYPELRLRTDVFETPDGTAVIPYIRESRRIKARTTIVQQDIDADFHPGPRARLFPDSCGIGLYSIDVHSSGINNMPSHYKPTKPYQIPVSALIPVRLTNLLAACKNLSATHLTNGAYRLHPLEWNIGEASGMLAAFCVAHKVRARDVPDTPALLKAYQHTLLDAGVPLYWWSDISWGSPVFKAVHLLGARGIVCGYSDLSYRPNNPLSSQDRANITGTVRQSLDWPVKPLTRGQAAVWLAQTLNL